MKRLCGKSILHRETEVKNFVDQQALPELTRAVIELKRKFFPNHGNLNTHWHDWLKSAVG